MAKSGSLSQPARTDAARLYWSLSAAISGLFGVEEALNVLRVNPVRMATREVVASFPPIPNSSCATSAYTRLTSSKNAFAENPFRKQMRIKGRSSVSRVVRSASLYVSH